MLVLFGVVGALITHTKKFQLLMMKEIVFGVEHRAGRGEAGMIEGSSDDRGEKVRNWIEKWTLSLPITPA